MGWWAHSKYDSASVGPFETREVLEAYLREEGIPAAEFWLLDGIDDEEMSWMNLAELERIDRTPREEWNRG